MNLSDCHEHIGKIATAWAEWNEAVDFAKREGDKRQKFAAERRDKLVPRLPKLEIDVENSVPSLAVFRGDIEIVSALYGTALSVDPGEISVSVRRGDKVLKTFDVTAKEAETAKVKLDLDAIDKEFPAPKEATPPTPTATAAPTATVAPRPRPSPKSSGQKTIGLVVGGVGVAALITAGALELVALSKKSKADQPDQCLNNYCSPNGIDTVDSAKQFANIGQWVGIGGVLLTAVGVTLVVSAPSPEETARRHVPRAAFAPWVGPTGGGLAVSGAL